LDWSVELSQIARKQLARIDRTWQRRIVDYLEDSVAALDDPRLRGKALSGDLRGLWRYRIGDYRAVCLITDATVTILVVEIGHRSKVYE